MGPDRFHKGKYFYGMLVRFLLPLLVSVTLLGSIGTAIGYRYLKTELGNVNRKLLETTLDNSELVLSELDSLVLAFDINPSIINQCYHILNTSQFGYKEHQDLNHIETYINAPVNARQYIDSIYLYYPNPYNRYIHSNDRGAMLGKGFEEGWHDSYLEHKDELRTWSEVRRLGQGGKEVITVYQMMDHGGVIVLNLDVRYMREMIESARIFEEQSVYVLNEQGEVLFYIGQPYSKAAVDAGTDVTYRMDSQRYHWSYISLVPQSQFYRLPLLMIRYTGIFLLLITIIGVVVAYFATRSSYRNFENLQEIIESARAGKRFDTYPVKESSDYMTYLTQQMVQNFIQQDFLKVQLSERKYKLRSMELLTMQSQMNPHFLYNTLETMNWKIMERTGRRTEINDMVENLSEILVYSLDIDHEYASLIQEIHVTECYIRILQERFGDQIRVEWQYSKELLQGSIVKFVLQPLIENAVNHGIREKESGSGRIRIRIYEKKEMIHIAVIDNGIGISKEKLKELREGLSRGSSSSRHIGIFNTSKRLKLAYGEEYGLTIQSREGSGTAVSVRIPVSHDEVEKSKDDTL